MTSIPSVPCMICALSLVSVGCSAGEAPTGRAPADLRPGSPVTARDPVAAPESSAPKVAFLGDSISAGLHLPADEAFPAVLAAQLRAEGVPIQLLNAGVSGDTTAGGLRRVDWLLKQGPAVVVVELGANDGLRGVPLQSIEGNLRAILTRVQEAGATALLLGMRLPPSYGAEYASGFDAIYPRLAAELGIALVPFFMRGVAGNPALNLQDGLHPTTEGHRRLADNVLADLRKLIRPGAPGP